MLRDNTRSEGMALAENPCRPDYETMIKRAQERLAKNQALNKAIFDYIGNTVVRGKMAELVGELYSEKIQIVNSIESMIAKQEAEQQ